MAEKLTLSLTEIRDAQQGLLKLVERYNGELGVAVSLRVARILRQLRPEVEVYEQQRNQLVLKYGEQVTAEQFEVPQGPALIAFDDDDRELLRQEIALNIDPLRLEELGLERVDADIVLLIAPVLAG